MQAGASLSGGDIQYLSARSRCSVNFAKCAPVPIWRSQSQAKELEWPPR